jgi:hypothetical protein
LLLKPADQTEEIEGVVFAGLGNGLLGNSLETYHTAVLLHIGTSMNLSKGGLKDFRPRI